MRRPFLTARWESLVLLNYACPSEVLDPLVPRGTELDAWNGQTLVSLVGFVFDQTRVRGWSIPFHRRFVEVNLRFYVRRRLPDGTVRRAVVFVRELVPRLAIATVARLLYNEPYVAVPMSSRVSLDAIAGGSVEYGWRHHGTTYTVGATVVGRARPLEAGSEAEFITEHYWGYTRQRDGGTLEYEVAHARWDVWAATRAHFHGPASTLYGPTFAAVLAAEPQSAFVALGSDVAVYAGERIA